MKSAASNPPENQLHAGLTEDMLRDAVTASGYPLQTLVAAKLLDFGFQISEEWVFVDDRSGQPRTLDLHASRRLYDRSQGQERVRPQLALVVECKRSDMPYVFFASSTRPGRGGQAVSVAGLKTTGITISTDDDRSTWTFSVIQALGLADHPFVADPPCVALSFSKAARRGKCLELSGSDPYHSLVLPLTKALGGYAARIAPPATPSTTTSSCQ